LLRRRGCNRRFNPGGDGMAGRDSHVDWRRNGGLPAGPTVRSNDQRAPASAARMTRSAFWPQSLARSASP
jgi:hypothetical protein